MNSTNYLFVKSKTSKVGEVLHCNTVSSKPRSKPGLNPEWLFEQKYDWVEIPPLVLYHDLLFAITSTPLI